MQFALWASEMLLPQREICYAYEMRCGAWEGVWAMAEKMRFAASYSGRKDGALALYRAIQSGHEPACLLTTYNEDAGRSWFHGVPTEVLYKTRN